MKTNNTRKYEQEVRSALTKLGKQYEPVNISYFNSELNFIAAIPIAKQRALHQEGFSFSDEINIERIWSDIWHYSTSFEVLNQCLFYFELKRKKKTLDIKDWDILKSWSQKIDNWAHADWISSLYATLHEENSSLIFPVFIEWNRSPYPWLRRLSIVSLYYYSSMRKKPVSFTRALPLVLNLLKDDHLYVQKGIGWTLREMYNLYPEKTLKVISKNVGVLPPAAWQAATEKLSKEDKMLLKKKRRELRGR